VPPATPAPRLIAADDPRSFPAEAYRVLRTNLHYANPDAPLRRILVTSTAPGEGKSTTLTNLGVTLAQAERSVLIVDADLRRPVVHNVFRQRMTPGLTSYLAGDSLLEAVLVKTAVANLSIVPSGPVPPNPAELLASKRMREFLEQVSERYDLVLLDSPPVLAVTDASALASLTDGVIFVVGSGKVPFAAVRRAKAQVEAAQGRILGVVINQFEAGASDGYSKAYYQRYYGRGR
jgi:capsular exopolysaccharide synthesis family protein